MTLFASVKAFAATTCAAILLMGGVATAQEISFGADATGEYAQNDGGTGTGIYPNDLIIGDPNAPVTIVEYASLTCGHCGTFHKDTYPEIEEEYLKTGKARLILRDLPWDGLAFSAALIARCQPAEKQAALYKMFLENQRQWRSGTDAIFKMISVAGIGQESAQACIDDKDAQSEMLERRQVAIDDLGVTGTPYFFVNGQRLSGNQSVRDMRKAIDKNL